MLSGASKSLVVPRICWRQWQNPPRMSLGRDFFHLLEGAEGEAWYRLSDVSDVSESSDETAPCQHVLIWAMGCPSLLQAHLHEDGHIIPHLQGHLCPWVCCVWFLFCGLIDGLPTSTVFIWQQQALQSSLLILSWPLRPGCDTLVI